ncbi:hypothetical protein [Marinobacterium aestuariivivens]|uniref:Fibronectin type-III domain-containing protein n=1 Tax=Marinobacterium aestuariivivens TaxID=1698799 RepID=A0ABW2A4W9_9GAMM
MKAKPSLILSVAFSIFLLSSCVLHQYHGVEPVSPSNFTNLGRRYIKTVDSLQPRLVWKSMDNIRTEYDLIIYYGIKDTGSRINNYIRGSEIYYREGLNENSHKVEKELSPNTVYIWSVRRRSGIQIGPWSTYDFQVALIPVPKRAADYWGENLWWTFRTPKQ